MILYLTSCEQKNPSERQNVSGSEKPKNIVLLIGDGMGTTQVSATFYFKEGGSSHFQRFPHIGLINTSSSSDKITDSAAGATAFACGALTYNGAVGVNDEKQPVENIIEHVSGSGYRSALISTSSITHATPACFYAHVRSRGMQELIAQQLATSEVDVFMGGGRKFFEDREDGLDVIRQLKEAGFDIFYDLDDLTDLDPDKKYGVLTAPDGMVPAKDIELFIGQ
jgi:alkaline phosphatase